MYYFSRQQYNSKQHQLLVRHKLWTTSQSTAHSSTNLEKTRFLSTGTLSSATGKLDESTPEDRKASQSLPLISSAMVFRQIQIWGMPQNCKNNTYCLTVQGSNRLIICLVSNPRRKKHACTIKLSSLKRRHVSCQIHPRNYFRENKNMGQIGQPKKQDFTIQNHSHFFSC